MDRPTKILRKDQLAMITMTVTTGYLCAVCAAILNSASPTDTSTVATATTYTGPEITSILMAYEYIAEGTSPTWRPAP